MAKMAQLMINMFLAGMDKEKDNAFAFTSGVMVMMLSKFCKTWYEVDPLMFKIWWPSVVGSVEETLKGFGIDSPLAKFFKDMVEVPSDKELREMLKKACDKK